MANFGKGRDAYPEWSDADLARLRELFPRTPWPELRAAFPRRTRQAIWQMGKNVLGLRREINRRDDYTEWEIAQIKTLYPHAEYDELLKALPGRSIIAIQRKACSLGVLRPKEGTRKNKRFVHPLFRFLRTEREKRKLSRPALAKKMGYHPNQLLVWELGKARPEFGPFEAWANALGFDVNLKERVTAEKVADVVIPWPDRKRLMAGRA